MAIHSDDPSYFLYQSDDTRYFLYQSDGQNEFVSTKNVIKTFKNLKKNLAYKCMYCIPNIIIIAPEFFIDASLAIDRSSVCPLPGDLTRTSFQVFWHNW